MANKTDVFFFSWRCFLMGLEQSWSAGSGEEHFSAAITCPYPFPEWDSSEPDRSRRVTQPVPHSSRLGVLLWCQQIRPTWTQPGG